MFPPQTDKEVCNAIYDDRSPNKMHANLQHNWKYKKIARQRNVNHHIQLTYNNHIRSLNWWCSAVPHSERTDTRRGNRPICSVDCTRTVIKLMAFRKQFPSQNTASKIARRRQINKWNGTHISQQRRWDLLFRVNWYLLPGHFIISQMGWWSASTRSNE